MSILGLGTQITDCARVRKLIDRHQERFLHMVFTEAEIRYCNERTHVTEFFTAIWATKEAVFRSLGTKWRRGMKWQDVEVLCDSAVEPKLKLHGATKDLAKGRGVAEIKITFAYSRLFATATAIAL